MSVSALRFSASPFQAGSAQPFQAQMAPQLPGAYESKAPAPSRDRVTVQTTKLDGDGDDAPKTRGSIIAGIACGAIGTGLVLAASTGIPGFMPAVASGTLANDALRLCGLVAFVGAHQNLAGGSNLPIARGALLVGAGLAGITGCIGMWGHIGGLTAVCMGVGGFISTLAGIGKMSDKDPS
jgi:hypothetical protein